MSLSTTTIDTTSIRDLSLQATQCEILCFIKEKCRLMTVDDISKVCSDLYREDEVFAAKAIIDQVLSSRLPKRQGNNKFRATIDDLIKTCLDPNISLPIYYAVDLSRIPPVDTNHCDVSAILAELQYLRAEVRGAGKLAEEVAELRREIANLQQMKVEVDRTRKELNNYLADSVNFPQSSSSAYVDPQVCPDEAKRVSDSHLKSFAHHAKGLKATGMSQPQPKKKSFSVVGSSTSNKSVKSVDTTRVVNVFVSRLHPMTTIAEVKDCVNTINGDSLRINDITCEKLKARYEHLYASFFVQLHVSASDMSRAIELFMSNESWPGGVLVRRYFPPKQQNG